MQCSRIAPVAVIAGIVMVLALTLAPAPAASHGREAGATERLLIPSASWHGRPIRDAHRHDAVRTSSTARRPAGWSAGPVAMGTGSHRPSGSERVREVQRRLRQLGYRPGPTDGIFGRRTRAAVGWFQVKHGLRVDGRATLATIRHLRVRTSPGGGARGARTIAPSTPRGAPVGRALAAQPPARDGMPASAIAGLVLLAFGIGFVAVALVQRRRDRAVLAPLPGSRPRAVGYVRVPAQARERASLEAHAAGIEARCTDHGMALAGVVSDDDGDDRAGRQRPGLAFALGQLESGDADCLVVGRLGHLTRSPAELSQLLDAMEERAAPLVVLNADPSTAARTGRWARAHGTHAGPIMRGRESDE